MFSKFSQFKRKSKKIHLSTNEKLDIRKKLSQTIDTTYVRKYNLNRHNTYRAPLFYSFKNYLLTQKPMFKQTLTALLIASMATGTTAYAAENANPTDTLYPVKTEFNERIRPMFAFGNENKAQWNQIQIQRRLDEAKFLTENGELTDEARTKLIEKLNMHITRMQEHLDKLAQEDSEKSAELEKHIEENLQNHINAVTKLETGEDVNLNEILKPVKKEKERLGDWNNHRKNRKPEVVKENLLENFDEHLQRFESKLEKTSENLSTNETLSEEEKAQIENDILQAQAYLNEAQTFFENGETDQAAQSFAQAHKLIEPKKGFNDFHNLSEEELKEHFNENFSEKSEDFAEHLEKRIEKIESDEKLTEEEKQNALLQIKNAQELLSQAKDAFENGDTQSAMELNKQAHDLSRPDHKRGMQKDMMRFDKHGENSQSSPKFKQEKRDKKK